jgi:xylulokinase
LACTLNASRIVDAGKEILGVDYDEFSSLALESEPGAGGLTLIPYFEGERMPNRPEANATLFGLTLKNSTRSNFARAFVEGMLLSLNDGVNEMMKLGVPVEKVYMIGGSMKSAAVRDIAPAIFGRDIILPTLSEYVADGAARQAAWALQATTDGESATIPDWKLTSEEVITGNSTPEVVRGYGRVRSLPTKRELEEAHGNW